MAAVAAEVQSRFSRRRRTGWIGIDIGCASLKIAQVERRHGRWRTVFGQVAPIDPDQTGTADGLHRTLTELLAGGRSWRFTSAACLLPWSATVLRTVDLPPTSESELSQLVAAAVRNQPIETYEQETAFWRACANRPAGKQTPVHILSVPSQLAAAAADRLAAARHECRTIDARPFALARAVEMSANAATGHATAAVDLGFDQTSVVIVRAGRPHFTRVLRDHGLRRLLETIEESLKLNHLEATALLGQWTMEGSAGGAVNRQINDAIANLARGPLERTAAEIGRTLEFARQMDSNLAPAQVCLFGGGATIAGLDQWLAEHLGVPTESWHLEQSEDLEGGGTPAEALLGEAIALSSLGWNHDNLR